MQKAEREIRELLASAARALHDKDADALTAHAAVDIAVCDLAPPLRQEGLDKRAIRAWFETWNGPIGYEVRDLRITVGDDVAFASGLAHMTGTKVDGEEVDLWYRTTDCLAKRDGRWLVVHRHESVPFYMDGSFRAAVDLSPASPVTWDSPRRASS